MRQTSRSSKSLPESIEMISVTRTSPTKWKDIMMNVLDQLKQTTQNKDQLISDLITIVSYVGSENYLQAALQLRGLKSSFEEQKEILKTIHSKSTQISEIDLEVFGQVKEIKRQESIKNKNNNLIMQDILVKWLNKKYHPYTYIIKNYGRLLQLKYKYNIDKYKLSIDKVQGQLQEDINILTQFMKKSFYPCQKLFKYGMDDEKCQPRERMQKFVQNYLKFNVRLSTSVRRIIHYAVKEQYANHLQNKIKNYVEPQQFKIPENFQINGCYARAICTLVEFAEGINHASLMRKLRQFRQHILQDINEFSEYGQQKILTVEIQFEILRFIVQKLKIFACEIFGQLKYLEFIYGDQQMVSKHQEISCMYTYLLSVFGVLDVQ